MSTPCCKIHMQIHACFNCDLVTALFQDPCLSPRLLQGTYPYPCLLRFHIHVKALLQGSVPLWVTEMRGGGAGRQAYETLTILEGTSNMAQQALQANARLKREDTYNLNAYFNKAAPSLESALRTFLDLWQKELVSEFPH